MAPRPDRSARTRPLHWAVAALLALLPTLTAAAGGEPPGPRVHASAATSGVFVAGPLGAGPGLTLRATFAFSDQIAAGAVLTASRHRVGEEGRLHLGHGAAEIEWRVDRSAIVPTVHVGAGVVAVFTADGLGQTLPVLHAAAGFDWWPAGPYRGLSLGAELRYVGTLDLAFTPILTVPSLRIGWGFPSPPPE